MNAFEETKSRESIVSDTLRSLTNQAKLLHGKIDLIEAGQQVARADVTAELGKLLDICQNLRDAILSEDSAAAWSTKEELSAVVDRLDDAAAKRRRYLDLAQLLAAGTVSHRRERTKQERLAQRDAAVKELMEISAQAAPPELPGPAIAGWLDWACSLEDGVNDAELQGLKSNFPRVDDFVRQLEIELWQDGPSASPSQFVHSEPLTIGRGSAAPALVSTEEPVTSNGFSGNYSLAGASDAAEQSPTAHSTDTLVAEAEPEPVEAPSTPVTVAEVGKICFFAPDEVAEFARAIEEAKGTSKKARKVRALLAVSQWLQPREQNPVLHSKCGIRARIGYTGTSDLDAVSPEEAEAAIESGDGLRLFTGGADLLRWGIAQSSEKRPCIIASISRLSKDQIRSWFVELFKIALSEPQVADIYRLTYGVPFLLGELHRLIIPVPEAPPTWLGYGIWTEMKARFERRLPTLCQELRNGAPSVRLANRELGLLKMVLIASDYSTPETIVSNLTENWYQYHPPELPAISPADEDSLALLQLLGLLPARTEPGLGPVEAILPLSAEDPVRQIASHL